MFPYVFAFPPLFAISISFTLPIMAGISKIILLVLLFCLLSPFNQSLIAKSDGSRSEKSKKIKREREKERERKREREREGVRERKRERVRERETDRERKSE